MPRNTRNSWVDLSVDGRINDIGTGPRAADGTMRAQFYVRDCGQVVKSVSVQTSEWNGYLALRVWSPQDELLFEHITERDPDDSVYALERGARLGPGQYVQAPAGDAVLPGNWPDFAEWLPLRIA